MSLTKVKIFSATTMASSLQEDIADFIEWEGVEIIDIKYSIIEKSSMIYYSALLIYKG